MIHDIAGNVVIFGFIVLFSFLIDYKKSLKYWYVLLLFFLIGIVVNLFNTITIAYPDTQIIKSNSWNNTLYCNWSPKIYSIVFVLILLIPLKNIITQAEIGLRLRQNEHSVRFSLIFILFIFLSALILGLMGEKGDFDIKALLFLAIMPGLSEELIYRGLLLGLLNKIFDKGFRFLGTDFGWGVILISIVFGLLHGFHFTADYQIQFGNVENIILTGCFGFIFALLKERSGSLIFPIIAHSTIDFFHFFIRMI